MFVCKSLLKNDSHTTDKYIIAYKKANELLQTEQETRTKRCSVVENSLNFDPRGPMAAMDVKCELELTGQKRKDLTWYKVIETETKTH